MSSEQVELPFGDDKSQPTTASTNSTTHPAAPESPPKELLAKPLPRIPARKEIAPQESSCTVKTGDLLVSHVGAEKMEWYGLLVLDTYGTKTLIGLALPAYQYGDRDLNKWTEWLGKHEEDDHTTIYRDVAPLAKPETA